MTFTIAEPCVGVKSGECVDVCPVDCIHPTPSEAEFETVDMIYINPAEATPNVVQTEATAPFRQEDSFFMSRPIEVVGDGSLSRIV